MVAAGPRGETLWVFFRPGDEKKAGETLRASTVDYANTCLTILRFGPTDPIFKILQNQVNSITYDCAKIG